VTSFRPTKLLSHFRATCLYCHDNYDERIREEEEEIITSPEIFGERAQWTTVNIWRDCPNKLTRQMRWRL